MSDDKKQKQGITLARAMEWASAGLIGLFSGTLGAIHTVRSNFYESIMDASDFRYTFDLRRANKEETIHDHLAQNLSTTENLSHPELLQQDIDYIMMSNDEKMLRSLKTPSAKGFIKEFTTGKQANTHLADLKITKGLGIETEGFLGATKGNWQMFETLDKPARKNVLFAGAIATLVGGAATMMFWNSLHTRETLDAINHKVNDR